MSPSGRAGSSERVTLPISIAASIPSEDLLAAFPEQKVGSGDLYDPDLHWIGTALSGFGIVTLASLFPITGVLLLCLYVSSSVEVAEIQQMAQAAANHGAHAV